MELGASDFKPIHRQLLWQRTFVIRPYDFRAVPGQFRDPIAGDSKGEHRADPRVPEAVLRPACDEFRLAQLGADQPLAFPKGDRAGFLPVRFDPTAKRHPDVVGQFLGEAGTGFLGEGDVAGFGKFPGYLGTDADMPLLEIDVLPAEAITLADHALDLAWAHSGECSQGEKDDLGSRVGLLGFSVMLKAVLQRLRCPDDRLGAGDFQGRRFAGGVVALRHKAPDPRPLEQVAEVREDVVAVAVRAFQFGIPPFLDVPLRERIEVSLSKRLPDDSGLAGGVVAGHRAIPVFVFGDVEVAASGDGSPLEIALPVECFLEDGFRIPELPADFQQLLFLGRRPVDLADFPTLQLSFDLLRQLFRARLRLSVLNDALQSWRRPCHSPRASGGGRRVEFHGTDFRVERHGLEFTQTHRKHTDYLPKSAIFRQYGTFKNAHKKPATN